MSRNPYTVQVTYTVQVNRYRTVSERLLSAIAAQSAARAAHDAARDAYDDRRRNLILDGIPGMAERCPSEVREAALARALEPQTRALRAAREQLRAADAELESARVQERAEREALRSLQLAHAHAQ